MRSDFGKTAAWTTNARLRSAPDRMSRDDVGSSGRGSNLVCWYVQSDGSVIVPPRVASWLKTQLGTTLDRRINMRGTDPEGYAVLTALHLSALGYRSGAFTSSPGGTKAACQQQDHAESQEWLTTTEAAELVGVTARCVRKWIENKQLPAKRHGKQYIVNRRHLTVQAMIA